jgi:hypothetical protein
MKVADARAAAWIVWTTALATDTRLNAHDRARLVAYYTKLGSTPTTQQEDLEAIEIHKKFFAKLIY